MPIIRSVFVLALVFFAASAVVSGCDDGGSNANESLSVVLASNAACYGIEIDVNDSGLAGADSAAGASCTADAALVEQGCTAFIEAAPGKLVMDVRGCFAADGQQLFQCTMSKALASRLRDSTEVRCGCGCATDCPISPTIEVCDGSGHDCEPVRVTASAESSAKVRAQTSSIPQTTASSSTTTLCCTGCDVDSEHVIRLADLSLRLREIQFDIETPAESRFCPVIGSCSLYAHGGRTATIEVAHNALHLCLSNPQQIGRFALAECNLLGDGDNPLTIRNVKALDQELRPIDPGPLVVTETVP